MAINVWKSLFFVGVTYALSWLFAISFFVGGGQSHTHARLTMLGLYMFTPMVSAIIVQKLIYKEPLKGPLGISFRLNRWFFLAWFLPPAITIATIGVNLLFPGVELASLPMFPFLLALLLGLLAGISERGRRIWGGTRLARTSLQRVCADGL